MMQFELEPEINIVEYGQQQQSSETADETATQDCNQLSPGTSGTQDQQPQTSEERIIAVIREENKSLRREIDTLNERVTWLTEAVVGLKELLSKGNQTQDFERSDLNFPLRTEFDLSFIDKEIGETHTFKNECISEMQRLFSYKSLSKTLSNVMAEELILDYNIDGVSRKKGLRNYGFFFTALIEAIRLTDSSQSPIKALQKAMHCIKNNACKKKSRLDESKSKKKKITEQ
ncbi:uncharacterized protein [Drosophila kikkawai]|uniref:Uncharacterized protein isoform X2 n=1 Tax=Drosophila kikkawai TaxID=30033 RepID=A0ABM4GJK3_DROKI